MAGLDLRTCARTLQHVTETKKGEGKENEQGGGNSLKMVKQTGGTVKLGNKELFG